MLNRKVCYWPVWHRGVGSKRTQVVEALGPDLEDTDKVTLALTGNLYDKTAFGGEWTAVIKKKGKRHGKNEQYQGHSNGRGKGPKK
jgi:hypothetical protein